MECFFDGKIGLGISDCGLREGGGHQDQEARRFIWKNLKL